MFYDKDISILSDGGYLDENGLWIDGESTILKTIECDIQPYSKELAYRDYSFEEDVKYRVFCDKDKDLKTGVSVKYGNEIYTIKKIVDWDSYYIILIDN